MIREPYIGMPIHIGATPGNRPGDLTSGSSGQGTGSSQNPAGDCTIDNTGGRNYDARLLGNLPLAMAYTPMQQWKTTYSRDVALRVGTVFPELDLPFEGGMRK